MDLEIERALRANDPGFSTDLSTGFVDNGAAVILRVALDTPLRRVFDYLPPPGQTGGPPPPGVRVRVPFGRRQLIGILIDVSTHSAIPAGKLKAAAEFLDTTPVFDPVTFELLRWASDYYHHPLGEVLAAALPAALRSGQPAAEPVERWSLTPAGADEAARPTGRQAPKQRALLAWLAARPDAAGSGASSSTPRHRRTRRMSARSR
jgi:primosomal protein N' (replication factor Y) (superfamily II helicase)